jgi:hypothetical protein
MASRKITVEIPSELLRKAQRASRSGVSQTVRTGLELLAASRAYAASGNFAEKCASPAPSHSSSRTDESPVTRALGLASRALIRRDRDSRAFAKSSRPSGSSSLAGALNAHTRSLFVSPNSQIPANSLNPRHFLFSRSNLILLVI